MKHILEVKDIAKSFKDYSSEWARIFSWFGLNTKPQKEHHILKHVSFNIVPGEAVGIVGQNGAGKSTLLKIITGTLKPSSGSVHVNGRISAILELGMGFHPDLTGRQNVYHSAGLMGFTHEQVSSVMKEIEEFAEIGEYFDQPVRTYSSGMQMRVAFGVATMYRPDVLIVDEALSVGDAYFQHKSFERIRSFQKEGTTLLLVSHDKGAIQAICNRAILLENGTVIKDAEPEAVMDFYNALIAEKENSTVKQVEKEGGRVITVSGTGEASVKDIGLYNEKGELVEMVAVGDTVELRISVVAHKRLSKVVLGYMIKDRLGQVMFGETTDAHAMKIDNLKPQEVVTLKYKIQMNFGVGNYSIATALALSSTHLEGNLEWKDLALMFQVVNLNKQDFIGSSWIESELELERAFKNVR